MPMCEGCHAGCCRSFAVPVTGADVLRMERDLGWEFWDFACRWADPEGSIARKYAPHFHFEDDPATPFVICLQHSRSKFFPQTTKCMFLEEKAPDEEHPLGTAHCGIYDSRPAACRVFPTKLDDSGDLAILHEVPSHGRGGTDEVYSLCPRQWTPADVDPLQVLPDLVVAKYEMQFFHQLAQVWNRQPKPWDVFPEFLRMVYANRVGGIPVTESPESKTGPAAADSNDTTAPSTLPFPPAADERRAA